MKTFLKVICLILALSALSVAAVSCDGKEEITDKAFYDYYSSDTGYGKDISDYFVRREINSMKVEDFTASDKESDYVLIKVKDYGDIVAVLRGDIAPTSVANFKKLVKDKFYDGTVFHRVINDFMIQGGGFISIPNEKEGGTELKEKESPAIKGEFTSNGFENNLLHSRGVLSMARSEDKNSASSQFFIVHQNSGHLNGDYASFGYVLAGMSVVDKIAEVKTGSSDIPIFEVVIESISFVEPK